MAKHLAEHNRFNAKRLRNKQRGLAGNVVWNTRDGAAPGTEVNMHDDEPVVMGEATMDSSSDSGSEGDETPEDAQAQKEALARAESHVQLGSYMGKGKEHKKRVKKAKVLYHQFA